MKQKAPTKALRQVADELNDCVICSSRPSQLCAGCKSNRYCNQQCQEADLSSHRLLCARFAKMPPRPSHAHRLVIMFQQDKVRPTLVWVLCEKIFEENERPYESAQVRKFLGSDNPIKDKRLVRRNPRRDRDLPHTIEVKFRDTFQKDASKLNRSVRRSVRLSGAVSHGWHGPIVVLRKRGRGTDPPFYGDILMVDYRHVLDYFLIYGNVNVK